MKITYYHRIDPGDGLLLLAYDENDEVILQITHKSVSSKCTLNKDYMDSLLHFEKIECDL